MPAKSRRFTSRVAVWGCSASGEQALRWLTSCGIAVGAVYDAFRRGEFHGHQIRDPYQDLDPALPVVIASAQSPERWREACAYLTACGVPYLFATAPSSETPPVVQPAVPAAVGAPEYWSVEEPCAEPPDAERLRRFKDLHRGERCFIIGNGPSLNRIDLSALANEVTFGVNGIFYKTRETGFAPTYYVVEDSHVMSDNRDAIDHLQVAGQKFFPTEYKPYINNREQVSFFRGNRGFYTSDSPNYCIPRFSTDAAERVYYGQSVTIVNLQLAYYMGFTTVYLIGMDFTYTIPASATVEGSTITSNEADPNHFHPDYFGAGKKWHDPLLHRVLQNYRLAKLVYESSDRKIYNATVGGKLEEFDRVSFDSVIGVR
jgi:hypothetical protein